MDFVKLIIIMAYYPDKKPDNLSSAHLKKMLIDLKFKNNIVERAMSINLNFMKSMNVYIFKREL